MLANLQHAGKAEVKDDSSVDLEEVIQKNKDRIMI
jgi:hypothetical protein